MPETVGLCNQGYLSNAHIDPTLAKSRSCQTYFSVSQSFWNFRYSPTVSLPCAVHNFKTTGRLINRLLAKTTSWDLGLRWVSDKYPILQQSPGPRFNIKMSPSQYRKSHCGDKTVVRSSYFHNGISFTGKITFLFWIRAQGPILNAC